MAVAPWTPPGALSVLQRPTVLRWPRYRSSKAFAGNSTTLFFIWFYFCNKFLLGSRELLKKFFSRFGGSGTVVIPFPSMLFRNSTFTLRLFFLLESPERVHSFADGLLLLDDDNQHWCYPIEHLWEAQPRMQHVVTSSAARWLQLYLVHLIRSGVVADG